MNDHIKYIDIQHELNIGVLSFDKIAEKYETSYQYVNLIWDNMCQNEFAKEQND